MRKGVVVEYRQIYFLRRNLREMIPVSVKWLSLPFLFVVAFLATSPALAALCSDSSLISQDSALKRQLAAVKNLERSRKCTAENAQGGFFNACRDLAQRRGDIQSKLQSNSAALARCSGTNTVSTTVTPKRTAKTPPVVNVKKAEIVAGAPSQFLGKYSGTPLLFCVRLSDGYYFPAPHSQYARSDQIKETLAQCSFICETSDVNLYVLNDPAAETSGMLSVDRRETYGSLPAAYRYQTDRNFSKCNWDRYNSYIQQVKFSREKPKKTKGIAVSKTASVQAGSVDDESLADAAPERDLTEELADRNVRIIGPEFLQQDNDKLINFETEKLHTDAGLRTDKSIE
ncbi:DUF2865 domain-containing protein [Pseudochrobactrum kiredjianiae]|uniref:DUF2865 domain-containing protein n=1 Tax=Pseudochrobactrum kiredjianiae TaxID=386305 RepID=UPI0035BBAC2A|nr:DUF2865 domain-containing protein [Pseudochrobactrum kiredjianiae]